VRAGRNARDAGNPVAHAFRATARRIGSDMGVCESLASRLRDCMVEPRCGRQRADGEGDNSRMLCSLSSPCLAVCGLIPLSRAKESCGHAHGWYGERSVGPWNWRRHSLRARLARPHTGAHDVEAPDTASALRAEAVRVRGGRARAPESSARAPKTPRRR
jgi:hypothetical protein